MLINLCEVGVLIKGIENQFLGVILVMKLLEDSFSYVNQFGVCQGVGVVYLNVYYFDILCFFDIKCENVDEKICIKMLLFGVVIFDVIFELVKKNNDMYFFLLYDVEKVYGVFFLEILVFEKYVEMVDDKCIKKKKINVCEFFQIIVEIQFESGYFYIMFEDMVNCVNFVYGCIIMLNLCSEILQVNEVFEFNEDLFYLYMGIDIFCNFGLLNIVVIMDGLDFGVIVEVVVCVLIVVLEMLVIDLVLLICCGNDEVYVVGFGQMNLYGFLVCEYIYYGFFEGVEFISVYFVVIVYYVICVLNLLVKEKGYSFKDFDKLKYVDGMFFDKYIECDWLLVFEDVIWVFENIILFICEDWVVLKVVVMKDGLYNCNLQVVFLIGLISYINNLISLIYLIVVKIEICKEGKIGWVYYFVVFMNNENFEYYCDVYEIGLDVIIDIYVVVIEYVDQGFLLMLFFFVEVMMCDINCVQIYVWKKGIKMIYYICLCQIVFEGIEV